MQFEVNAYMPSVESLIDRFGLDKDGRTQKVIDNAFIHFMRLKMPIDSEMMILNTRNPEGGLVTVEVPYAHYQNEGILYVDPVYDKGAFHDPISGRFWSRPNVSKVPSNRPLNYHGGANRGAHFVERTISENEKDISKIAQEEVDRL